MPKISSREGEFSTRFGRLKTLKKGPGVFVYNGNAVDKSHTPTPMRAGKRSIKFGADGVPVQDASGREVYEPPTKIVRDEKGHPIMGGPPVVEESPVKVFKLRGKEFPLGERVVVNDHKFALKLRGMDCFDECTEQKSEQPEQKSEQKRPVGRPPGSGKAA